MNQNSVRHITMLSRVSEVFYSLQGEGRRVGHPSVFVRFFGCNFRCPGFGLPPGQESTEPDEIAKNKEQYHSYSELPLAKTGCDSYPSWHPSFKEFSPEVDEDQLVMTILDTLNGVKTENVDLVFTGGEPLLPRTQKFIVSLFQKHSDKLKFNLVSFETNGSQSPSKELIDEIQKTNKLLFSISPKLKCSGVPREKAIRPDVLNELSKNDSYLKFVVSNIEDLDEINDIIKDVNFKEVYIMPEGGIEDRYNSNLRKTALIALAKGFILSPRLHVTIFGNTWGT